MPERVLMSKRILIASPDFLPQIGGVSLMCHYMANELARTGHDVTTYGPVGSRIPADYPARYRLITENPVSHIGAVERHKRELGLWQPSIFKNFERLHASKPFDRILLLQPFVYGWPALLMQRRYNVPVSVYFHGYELRSKLIKPDNTAIKIHSLLTGVKSPRTEFLALAREGDQVLTNSHYTADLVRSVPGHRTPIVTGCGLDEDVIRKQFLLSEDLSAQDRVKNRAAFGLDARPTLGFVGRLQESKGIRMLFDVIRALPEVQGLIVGPEDGEWKELAINLGIADRITFLGKVDEDTKWRALRCMDVSCLFSRELGSGHVEGFGISLLEAAAAGCTVAITKSGGMVDVVQHGKTGFAFDVDDVDSAVKALRAYLAEPDPANEITRNLRSRIVEDFNWTTITKRLVSSWT